jgi:hypothetical protein
MHACVLKREIKASARKKYFLKFKNLAEFCLQKNIALGNNNVIGTTETET